MRQPGAKMQASIHALLQRQAKPLSAYQILSKLQTGGGKLAPPTIYRALTGLIEGGKVHRIESINAYVSCRCASHGGASVLSICEDCGMVEEHLDAKLVGELAAVTQQSGFVPQRQVIEVHGLCGSCNSEAEA